MILSLGATGKFLATLLSTQCLALEAVLDGCLQGEMVEVDPKFFIRQSERGKGLDLNFFRFRLILLQCYTKCEVSFLQIFLCMQCIAINILVFYVASQRKNDCKSNFRVFSTVFLRYTKNLVEIIRARFSVELLNNGFDRKTRYLHMSFETLRKVLQRKGKILQFELSCYKTPLFSLFFYI